MSEFKPLFRDRRDAGQKLAQKLEMYRDAPDTIVLALPRGGVPVAHEIAKQLHLPLDLLIVQKLGAPGHEELAIGALAPGPTVTLNPQIMHALTIGQDYVDELIAVKAHEIARRNHLYRQDRPLPPLQNQTVLLVDDGVATGADMRVALMVIKRQGARKTVIATPVIPADILESLKHEADELVALTTPTPFFAVGQAYACFDQLADAEVLALLAEHAALGFTAPYAKNKT